MKQIIDVDGEKLRGRQMFNALEIGTNLVSSFNASFKYTKGEGWVILLFG